MYGVHALCVWCTCVVGHMCVRYTYDALCMVYTLCIMYSVCVAYYVCNIRVGSVRIVYVSAV